MKFIFFPPGTILRSFALVYFVLLLVLTSGKDSGDWLACAGCIALFSLSMMTQQIAPGKTACFMLVAFVWGRFVQPAVLNQCQLALWMLIFAAFSSVVGS
jgi:hypothetical protein